MAALIGTAVQIATATVLVPAWGQGGAGLASFAGYGLAAIGLAATEVRVFAGRGGIRLGVAIIAGAVGLAAATQLAPFPLVARLAFVTLYCSGAAGLAWALGRDSRGRFERD
jgi:hypothetical protein